MWRHHSDEIKDAGRGRVRDGHATGAFTEPYFKKISSKYLGFKLLTEIENVKLQRKTNKIRKKAELIKMCGSFVRFCVCGYIFNTTESDFLLMTVSLLPASLLLLAWCRGGVLMSTPSDRKLKFTWNFTLQEAWLASSIMSTLLLMYSDKYRRRWERCTAHGFCTLWFAVALL